MKYLTLKNGDKLPSLGLGTWKSEPGVVYEAVREAIRIGYRHIDCAAIYNNEQDIGQALSDAIASGDCTREELWITSKLWNNAHLTPDVKPALMKTLSDLKLDYLDLYLIHWPVAHKPDAVFPDSPDGQMSLTEAPITETWKAMEALVDEELCRHIGVSNFSAKKLEPLLSQRIKPEMNQVEMHPLLQQPKLKRYCDTNEILMTAYSPLGSGDRNAAMKADNEPNMMENHVIVEIAEAHQVTPAQILLAWAVSRGTAVIPKSVNPGRLKLNLEAADIELGEADIRSINELDKHFRYVTGAFWDLPGGPYNVTTLWDE